MRRGGNGEGGGCVWVRGWERQQRQESVSLNKRLQSKPTGVDGMRVGKIWDVWWCEIARVGIN